MISYVGPNKSTPHVNDHN